MKKYLFSLFSALFLTACPSQPNPQPIATGGNFSTGGSAATGGNSDNGGSSSLCSNIDWPTYDNLMSSKKITEHHKFTTRHFRPKIRAFGASLIEKETSACSQWHQRNVPEFDQGPVGSCTGNAVLGAICTEPFTDISRCSQSYAIQAYQGGTCVDNGCSLLNCSCTGCKKSYCPTTGANDNGSTGYSVFTWMKSKGWVNDFVTADTEIDLTAGIQKTACAIGVYYYYSMEIIGSDCHAVVNPSSGLAGGHEVELVGKQIMPNGSKRWWFINSWGIWGCKDSKGYYGYAWLSNDELFGSALQMDGDCPIFN